MAGYVEADADAAADDSTANATAGTASPSAAAAPIKYNCGGKLAALTRSPTATATSPAPLGIIDCARLLMDYSPAGSAADIQALPTARLFKLSAFGA